MSADVLGSAINRLSQLQQVRETALEASAANAATGEVYHGGAAAYQLTQGRFSSAIAYSRRSRGSNNSDATPTASSPALHSGANPSSTDTVAAGLTPSVAIFDVSSARERSAYRSSVVNRRRAASNVPEGGQQGHIPSTMPNRRMPAWQAKPAVDDSSAAVPASAVAVDGSSPAPTTDAEATVAAEEAEVAAVPFPWRKVLCIIAAQLLSLAPAVIFAAIAPFIYGTLVGDLQTAGTVSSVAVGVSMGLQVMATPVLAQLMDLYGRRRIALFACIKAVAVCLPLLAAGIIIHINRDAEGAEGMADVDRKLGAHLTGSTKTLVHALFVLFWAISLLASATNSAHALVAIADVCQSQQHRCMAIGMFAGLANLLAVFAIVGSHFSLVLGGTAAVGLAVGGFIFTFFFMPETIDLSAAPAVGVVDATPAAATAVEEKTAATTVDAVTIDIAGVTPQLPTSRNRRSIYPSQIRARGTSTRTSGGSFAHQLTSTQQGGAVNYGSHNNRSTAVIVTSADLAAAKGGAAVDTAASINVSAAPAAPSSCPQHTSSPINANNDRRVRILVSPFKGFAMMRQSRSAMVALAVLFTCLMAEISASDTLVFYLSITLNFGPDEVSYLQIEKAALSLVICAVIGPVLTRYMSCARQCMLCAVFIAAALVVLAAANSKMLIFAAYVPCISMGSIMIPSVAAVITKGASTPEEVSLSMGTVMSLVALLQAGGSFFAALVFKTLSRDTLWITFVISAAFTLPMFILSIYLEIVCLREAAAEAAAKAAAAEAEAAGSAVAATEAASSAGADGMETKLLVKN